MIAQWPCAPHGGDTSQRRLLCSVVVAALAARSRVIPEPLPRLSVRFPTSILSLSRHSSVSHGSLHRGAWLPVSQCCTPWIPCSPPLRCDVAQWLELWRNTIVFRL